MRPVSLHSKEEIETFLRRDTFLHIYGLGDLDDFFWQYTSWFALKSEGEITQLALIYSGTDLPVLLGLGRHPASPVAELLRAILPLLPKRIYAHLPVNGATILADEYRVQSHGVHYKMALVEPSRLAKIDASPVVLLTPSDLPALEELYRLSYPENWFDPRMLETGYYYGIRRGHEILSVAGVHVYSARYRVAALGNITTRSELRGQGLGRAVTSRLCIELLRTVDHIGLNVRADNASAIACYEKIGFRHIATYEEFLLDSQRNP